MLPGVTCLLPLSTLENAAAKLLPELDRLTPRLNAPWPRCGDPKLQQLVSTWRSDADRLALSLKMCGSSIAGLDKDLLGGRRFSLANVSNVVEQLMLAYGANEQALATSPNAVSAARTSTRATTKGHSSREYTFGMAEVIRLFARAGLTNATEPQIPQQNLVAQDGNSLGNVLHRLSKHIECDASCNALTDQVSFRVANSDHEFLKLLRRKLKLRSRGEAFRVTIEIARANPPPVAHHTRVAPLDELRRGTRLVERMLNRVEAIQLRLNAPCASNDSDLQKQITRWTEISESLRPLLLDSYGRLKLMMNLVRVLPSIDLSRGSKTLNIWVQHELLPRRSPAHPGHAQLRKFEDFRILVTSLGLVSRETLEDA